MAMEAADVLEVTAGISDTGLYYVLGGSLLVVLAAYWGFNKLLDLLYGEELIDTDGNNWGRHKDDEC